MEFNEELQALSQADADMQTELLRDLAAKIITPQEFIERLELCKMSFRQEFTNIIKGQ